jgi:anti-sigma factor RsiW
MTCSELLARLDDLLDGALAPEERVEINRHLSLCAGCRNEAEARAAVQSRVDGLARWVDPPRDLWPGIVGRIELQKVERGRFGSRARRVALAAAAAAVVAAAMLAAYTVGRRQSQPMITALDPSEFRHARTELLVILEQRRHQLSPETLRVVDSNLQLIDGAIDEITLALGRDPDNPQLSHRLAAVYRQQIELLRTATGLPSEI